MQQVIEVFVFFKKYKDLLDAQVSSVCISQILRTIEEHKMRTMVDPNESSSHQSPVIKRVTFWWY